MGLKDVWNRIADEYAKKKYFGKGLFKEEKQNLPKILKNCKKILDVGCGSGRHLKFIKNLGKEVVGLDFSEEMIKNARKVFDGKLVVADVRNLPFEDKSFDCVVCLGNSFGCLFDEQKALDEMIRVSKKKVVIEIRVGEKEEIYIRKFGEYEYLVKVWNKNSFEKFLLKNNLNFERIEGHKLKNSRFVYYVIKV